jgi:rod shape-determining protein MreD
MTYGADHRPSLVRSWGTLALLFAIAGALQTLVAYPIARLCGGAQPDLLLTIACSAALLSDAPTGALIGFLGGLCTAALVGQTVGTYVVSRTVAGYLAGQFTTRVFQANLFVVMVGVFAMAVTAAVVQFLAAPPHHGVSLIPWLRTILCSATFDAVLALPVAALLRRAGWRTGIED